MVKALVAVAVTVTDAPRLTEEPLIVMALFDKDALAMFVSVLSGPLIVLFVSVCVPVNVTTVESIAIVTGEEPLNEVPDKPVPMVNVLVVFAVIVPDAPSATVTPL